MKRKISRETIDVPSAVHRLYFYKTGQSKSSYLDDLSYTTKIMEGIEFLSFLKIHIGIHIYDKLEKGLHVNFRQVNRMVRILVVYVEFILKSNKILKVPFFYYPSFSDKVKILKQGIF